MTATCPNGHLNQDGSAFCSTCGAAIPKKSKQTGAESAVAAAPAPAAPDVPRLFGQPRWVVVLAAAIAAVLLIAAAVVIAIAITNSVATAQQDAEDQAAADKAAAAEAARLKLLPAAVAGCDLDSGIVQDGGRSAFLDNSGNDFGSGDLDVADLICVLNALDTPDAVINHMSNTRSLDGTQSDSWGDFSATWTYHPDDGLDIIIKLAD